MRGNTAPAGHRQKAQAQFAAYVDQGIQADVLAYAEKWDATKAYYEKALADSRKPRVVDDPLRELVLYHRLADRTLAEVADMYERDNEGLLTFLVESETDLPRAFRLRGMDTDKEVKAIRRMQEITAAKVAKRQDAQAVEHLNVIAEQERVHMNRRMVIRDARRNRNNPEYFKIARLTR